jgi:hypothetical protein
MSDPDPTERLRYIDEVLRRYRTTPTVAGHVRRADRILAGRLFDQGVPLYAVANALILGAGRRILHNGFSAPMPPVQSLHYFEAIVREVLERPPGYRELALFEKRLAAYRART